MQRDRAVSKRSAWRELQACKAARAAPLQAKRQSPGCLMPVHPLATAPHTQTIPYVLAGDLEEREGTRLLSHTEGEINVCPLCTICNFINLRELC